MTGPDDHRIAMLRVQAAAHRLIAMRLQMAAAAVAATQALRRMNKAMQQAYDQELTQHPDLGELNVQLDARYDKPS